MKIGPVFLEHVGLVSKTCWYWRINQSLSNACEGSASCNIVYADCAALQVWRKKWLTTCDYREKTWCFTTCRRLPGPPATSSVERAKAKHRCVLSPVHTGDKVDRIGDKVDRVGDNVDRYKLSSSSCCDLSPKQPATKSTVSATVDFLADLSPVSATVDFVASVYRALAERSTNTLSSRVTTIG